MKNIKKYDNFVNEELNFNFLKRRKKEEPVKEEPIEKTYEDDDLFDTLFKEIKNSFDIDNLSWGNNIYLDYTGWKYTHNGDEIVIFNTGLRVMNPVLMVNKIELDVNPDKIKELGRFFKEKDENKDEKIKKDVKEKITGNRDITDDKLADYIFNEIKNTDIKLVNRKKRNGFNGYAVDVADTYVHFINTRGERGGAYPINNMFVYDNGFKINIDKLEEITKYLSSILSELDNKKETENKKKIRDKYLSK